MERNGAPLPGRTVDATRAVTLRDLLTHTSGLMSGGAYFSGGGGLFSTAEDYLQFALMLMNGGQHENTRLLGARTVELMASAFAPDTLPGRSPGEGWGLSVRVVRQLTGSPWSQVATFAAFLGGLAALSGLWLPRIVRAPMRSRRSRTPNARCGPAVGSEGRPFSDGRRASICGSLGLVAGLMVGS